MARKYVNPNRAEAPRPAEPEWLRLAREAIEADPAAADQLRILLGEAPKPAARPRRPVAARAVAGGRGAA